MSNYRFRFVADIDLTADNSEEAIKKLANYFQEILSKGVKKSLDLSQDSEIHLFRVDTEEEIEIREEN